MRGIEVNLGSVWDTFGSRWGYVGCMRGFGVTFANFVKVFIFKSILMISCNSSISLAALRGHFGRRDTLGVTFANQAIKWF